MSKGLPGMQTARTATPRQVCQNEDQAWFAQEQVILDASVTRDYGNGTDYEVIRAGMPLVKVVSGDTYGAAGLYVPWVLGTVTTLYDASSSLQTSLTVGVGAATAIQKFLGGTTGSVWVTGSATAAGAISDSGNGYLECVISAINTTTGVLTITAMATDMIVGSLIHPYEDREPEAILAGSDYGIKVTDRNEDDVDTAVQKALISGIVNTSYFVGWPPSTATSLLTWIRAELKAKMPALYFSDVY